MDEGRRPRAEGRRRRPPRPRRIQPPPQVPLLRRLMTPNDLYHRLLTIPWSGFFGLLTLAYGAFNAVFAALYLLQAGSIANVQRGFADAFFFSVQTMATIGYGEMRPVTLYANVLVTIEVLLGLMGFALATGVIFARVSRPTARVLFSKIAVVTQYDGRPTLMFRAANQRTNRILQAQASLSLARNEMSAEGYEMRRFHELRVERAGTPLFSLSWTVMHVIDEETSPLHGATPESLAERDVELIATLVGYDETLAQIIRARHSFRASEILFGRRFADILTRDADGVQTVDYRRFHDTLA
jgi:inward rectifier potassium channel